MTEAVAPGTLARLSARLIVLAADPDGEAHVCEVGSTRVYRVPSAWIAKKTALPGVGLTPREEQVLRAAAEGLTNKEIGARLGCGPQTVKNHLTTIYRKLRVGTRVEAVIWLMDQAAE